MRYFPALIAGLPAGPPAGCPSIRLLPPRMSRLATAALACAVAGPLTAGITAVPATPQLRSAEAPAVVPTGGSSASIASKARNGAL
jgi:hypothetical protein